MWPFRRKPKSPDAGPDPAQGVAVATAPSAPPERRTADDVLRQLEADTAAAKAIFAEPQAPADPNIGHCLLAEGPVTREFLDRQVRVAGKADSYIGRLLADIQAANEAGLMALLAIGYEVPEVDLKQCKVHVPTARSIPREIALKYKIVPIDRIGDMVCIVFSGEPNPKAIEAVRRETGARVKALRCPSHHLQILLRRLYTTQPAAPTAQAAPAAQAVAAVPISKQDYDQATASPAAKMETRWEALFASKGPIRAGRLGRRSSH